MWKQARGLSSGEEAENKRKMPRDKALSNIWACGGETDKDMNQNQALSQATRAGFVTEYVILVTAASKGGWYNIIKPGSPLAVLQARWKQS